MNFNVVKNSLNKEIKLFTIKAIDELSYSFYKKNNMFKYDAEIEDAKP